MSTSTSTVKTPLTKEDIKLLKTKGRKMTIALISFMAFGLLLGILALLLSGAFGFLIAVCIIVVVPISIFLYYYWNFVSSDAKKEFKNVISGHIEDKKMDTSETKGMASSGNSRQSYYYTRYYFLIDGNEVLVDENAFNQYKTGDRVEIHQAASGLFMYCINPEGITTENNDYEPICFDQMSDEEYNLFIKIRNKVLKQVLISSFVFGFIVYWIILFITIFLAIFFARSQSDQIIDFFSWALIIAILMVIWLVNKKTLVALFFDSRQASKQIQTLKIADKVFSNTKLKGNYSPIEGSGYYYFKLNNELYHVDKDTYERLSIGDRVTLYLSTHAKVQLGIAEAKV